MGPLTILEFHKNGFEKKNDSGHLICHLEPEKGAVCLQHTFPQFVFSTYSPPHLKRGRRVFIIKFFKKKAIATG